MLNRHIITLPFAGARTFQMTVNIILFVSLFARNSVMAIGSYECYISMCHPFQVSTNKVVNNMKLSLGIVWIFTFILTIIVVATETAEYCFGEFGAISSKLSNHAKVVSDRSVTMTLVIFAICLSKV